MRLSEIAQAKGDMETSILLERKRTMYQDSAQINQQGHDILNTIIARERNNSNTIVKRSTLYIYTTSVVFLAISFICIFYFRKKHLQHKAEKKEWEETLQAEIAKANLKRKQAFAEKERENAALQEKVSRPVVKKPAHGQEEYKTSALYAKVSRITKELQKVETKENLNEEEWSQFIALTNAGWYGIITYLDERYNLSAEEIRICCLYLAQVPVIHMGHFLHIQSRSTIQARTKNILLKWEHLKDFH